MPTTEIRVFRDADGLSPLMEWLNELETNEPKVYRKCLYSILALHQHGNQLRRPMADFLRDGVYELRPKKGHVHYRLLYGFVGRRVAMLALGATKEGMVEPKDIDRAVAYLALAAKDLDRYTMEFEI